MWFSQLGNMHNIDRFLRADSFLFANAEAETGGKTALMELWQKVLHLEFLYADLHGSFSIASTCRSQTTREPASRWTRSR